MIKHKYSKQLLEGSHFKGKCAIFTPLITPFLVQNSLLEQDITQNKNVDFDLGMVNEN